MKRVLFICAGNICRSPMAEGIFRRMLRERGLEAQFEVDSCGTGNWHEGERAHPLTESILEKNHAAFEHSARQIWAEDWEQFDFIFAMDKANLRDLERMYPQHKGKAKLMLENAEVPDPYYGNLSNYEQVYTLLEPALEAFLNNAVQAKA